MYTKPTLDVMDMEYPDVLCASGTQQTVERVTVDDSAEFDWK